MQHPFTPFKFCADSPVIPRLEKLGLHLLRTGPNEVTVLLINKGIEAVQQSLQIERERIFNRLTREIADINEALRHIDESQREDSESPKLLEVIG